MFLVVICIFLKLEQISNYLFPKKNHSVNRVATRRAIGFRWHFMAFFMVSPRFLKYRLDGFHMVSHHSITGNLRKHVGFKPW